MASSGTKSKTKNKPQEELELRGQERSFQFDRDTVLVYTGLHVNDMRPFIRIGAGDNTPGGILSQIENVILTDKDPVNVGLEMFWMHSTLSRTGAHIRYIGSRDAVSQVYGYSGIRDMPEEQKPPVDMEFYRPLQNAQVNAREKCLINFFETGNVNVSVAGSKALDLNSFKKAGINLDKEYDMISRALSRRQDRKCEQGFGFLFLSGSNTPGQSIYWNMEGSGLLLNPPRDYHYKLFENTINPDQIKMTMASSAVSPGFVECLRRKNAQKQPVGAFSLDGERMGFLKRIYSQAKLKIWDDSSSLPYAKGTQFFLSRSSSHCLFVFKMSETSERRVQVLLPTGGTGRVRKSFDYLHGPHDLELEVIEDKDDFKAKREAHLRLHTPGKISSSVYERTRLSAGNYPLLGEREYKMSFGDTPGELYEQFVDALTETEYQPLLKDYILLMLGLDFSEEAIDSVQGQLLEFKATREPALRNNLFETLRFIGDMPNFTRALNEKQQKLHIKLMRRYRLESIRHSEWLAMGEDDIELFVVFLAGKRTYHLVRELRLEILRFIMPPTVEQIEKDPREFRTLLKKQSRIIDRAFAAPGYRECLELMERFYEEKVRLVTERVRFKALLEHLNMELEPRWGNTPAREGFIGKTLGFFSSIPGRARSLYTSVLNRFR